MIERPDPVNWSTLRHMRTSPKHYIYFLANPPGDTDARLRGRVTHCAIYEPAALDARYVVEPHFHRGMKDETAREKGYAGGKEAAAAWEESIAASGAEVVKPELYFAAIKSRDSILADAIAGPMVRGGYAEQLITWTDAATGIECRGRVDHVNGCLSDLKTTRSVSPRLFNADIARYGYHAQIAYYFDGLAANGIPTSEPPALIVVESEPPHDVVVLEFSEQDIAAGRAVYRECLDRLAWCRSVDQWPGVSDGRKQRVALPAWAMPEEEPLTMGGVAVY